jgi:hypothetical protein
VNVRLRPVAGADHPGERIDELRYARFDLNRALPMRVTTVRFGTLRLVPRLSGFLDVLVELRRLNAHVKLP